jgi:hypothetical protein
VMPCMCFYRKRVPEKGFEGDTHQRLIVVEHEEKVDQGPILACLRGRQAGLGLRPALVRTRCLRGQLRLLTGGERIRNELRGRCRRLGLLSRGRLRCAGRRGGHDDDRRPVPGGQTKMRDGRCLVRIQFGVGGFGGVGPLMARDTDYLYTRHDLLTGLLLRVQPS